MDPATGFAPACSLLQVRRLSMSATPEKEWRKPEVMLPIPRGGHSAFEAVRARLSRSASVKIGRSGPIRTGISRLMKPAHGSLCYGAGAELRNAECGVRNDLQQGSGGRRDSHDLSFGYSALRIPNLKWWTVSVMLRPVSWVQTRRPLCAVPRPGLKRGFPSAECGIWEKDPILIFPSFRTPN